MTISRTNNFEYYKSLELHEHLRHQVEIQLDKLQAGLTPKTIVVPLTTSLSHTDKTYFTIVFINKQGNEEPVIIYDFSHMNHLSDSAKLQIKQKVGILIVLGVL